jgi:transposase-like protein
MATNNHKRWTAAEERNLIKMYKHTGHSIPLLAMEFGRTPAAIQSKINELKHRAEELGTVRPKATKKANQSNQLLLILLATTVGAISGVVTTALILGAL